MIWVGVRYYRVIGVLGAAAFNLNPYDELVTVDRYGIEITSSLTQS
jgi:hypothetical protein